MKTKKHRNRNLPNPVARGFPPAYEPSFKRSVILYAEQKSNQEARKRFGISEETIKRWRKLRQDIMEKAQQCIRRSQRHTMGHGSFSESVAPATSKKEKEKSIEKEKGIEDMFEDDLKKDLDSMPLQQRLSQNHNETSPATQAQESQLHSLPISPTKLKVTRQGKPQPHSASLATPQPPEPPQVCLKWNSHHTNLQAAFPNLLMKEQYVDATLVSEGKTLKCHRMILSSCSPYFEEVLNGISPFQHPVLFMKDIPFWTLKALCDFMYAGEVHILQDKLQELLNVATNLKIKGLAGPPDCNQEPTLTVPEIKQEIDQTHPPKIVEKAVKEEKEEEPSLPLKVPRYESAKYSKKREDRKSKHAYQSPKEKEKMVEEPKNTVKVAPKIVLPKAPPASKTSAKNVVRNAVKPASKPSTSKITHTSRKSETSRKNEKHKMESVLKEKEKEKEKPLLKKGNINDPLDLLQPVYEEIAKEETPRLPKSVGPGKIKERGNVSVKKGMNRRVRKRRYAEYVEDRDESPPPLFQSRKGTRSRPNVKIPKYFHTHFDDSPKETVDATIVREPHTDQNDPLIGVEVDEIKAEPLDVEENTIEMEENLVNFVVPDQEMISQEGEEIIGNYDSPLVNIKIEPKRNTPNIFKKVLETQSVLMDIHSVSETNVRLLNIKEENVQFVDISRLSTGDGQIDSSTFSQIGSPRENPSEIIISSVQSMAELSEESRLRERDKHTTQELTDLNIESDFPKCVEIEATSCENRNKEKDNLKSYARVGVKPLESLTSQQSLFVDHEEAHINPVPSDQISYHLPSTEDDPLAQTTESHLQSKEISNDLSDRLESDEVPMEIDPPPLQMKIENVRSEKSQISNEAPGNSEIFEQYSASSGSLGSLEAKVGDLGIESQNSPRHNNNSQCDMEIASDSQEMNNESTVSASIPDNSGDKSESFKANSETHRIVEEISSQRVDNCNSSNLGANIYITDEDKDSNLVCNSKEVDGASLKTGIEASEYPNMGNDMSSKIILQHVEQIEELSLHLETTESLETDVNKSNVESQYAAEVIEERSLHLETTDSVEVDVNNPNAENRCTAHNTDESLETEILLNKTEIQEVETHESSNDATEVSAEDGSIVNVDSKNEYGALENTNDLTTNIEAELEQCLASTSHIAPSTQKINLGDDEDFTKDIEIESFYTKDKPSNDLRVEFDSTEIPKADKASNPAQGEADLPVDTILEGNEKSEIGSIKVNCNITENLLETEKEESCGETFSQQFDTVHIAQSDVDEKLSKALERKLHSSAAKEKSLQHTETREESNKDLIIDRLLPKNEIVTVNSTEHHTSFEEEQRMEETLLADLDDDDILMKDASTCQDDDDDDDDDGSEKTLEMIVNDLNESLGEMRK